MIEDEAAEPVENRTPWARLVAWGKRHNVTWGDVGFGLVMIALCVGLLLGSTADARLGCRVEIDSRPMSTTDRPR